MSWERKIVVNWENGNKFLAFCTLVNTGVNMDSGVMVMTVARSFGRTLPLLSLGLSPEENMMFFSHNGLILSLWSD